MMTVLEGFHHRVNWRLLGMTEIRGRNGEWEHPLVAMALVVTGLWKIQEYVGRYQALITQYIAGRPIFEICM